MIQSYNEEVTSKKRKNIIFWTIVSLFACYLYLFFQGYYLNIDLNLKTNEKEKILKQFWIINIWVHPEADSITINWTDYKNIAKNIFDFGRYIISIKKDWYIWMELIVDINKDNLFYSNNINLIKNIKYSKVKEFFTEIKKIWTDFLAYDKDKKLIKVLDQNFNIKKAFYAKDFVNIGQNYFFSYWKKINIYNKETNNIEPILSVDKKELECIHPKIVNEDLFCNDNMSIMNIQYKYNWQILKINENIILTKDYIYNYKTDWNWNYYKYKNIINPDSIIHVLWEPYYLEWWSLYKLDSNKEKLNLTQIDWIRKTFSFQDEDILIWYKWNKKVFVYLDSTRTYFWYIDDLNIDDLKVYKINWIYFFKTNKEILIYYKWWTSIIKILTWDILDIIDNKIYFNKDGNTYVVNLAEE